MLRLLGCTKHSCGRKTRQTIHIIGNLRVIQTFIQSIYIYVHAYIHPHTHTHTAAPTTHYIHTHSALDQQYQLQQQQKQLQHQAHLPPARP